jgi:hypothetical protein
MIRYSYVRLMIHFEPGRSAEVSTHLGVQPSGIIEPEPEDKCGTWYLDSPKDIDSDPTARLHALADAIEPFADRLMSLDAKFHRGIDVLYHTTPQHSHGVTGEFDWFQMPAALMRRFSAWNLDLSYETIWFDHPDWKRPQTPGFLSRLFGRANPTSPNHALQRTAPGVTLAAADHPAACAHPAPGHLRPQPARRPPQSLSLGSLGACGRHP